MKTYSNPRTAAEILDWPLGSGKRGVAFFRIEDGPNGKQRGVRTTTGKPKKLTYANKARIVDGSDGRTYIAELTAYGFISIMRGDMKYEEETIHENDPRYAEVKVLFDN